MLSMLPAAPASETWNRKNPPLGRVLPGSSVSRSRSAGLAGGPPLLEAQGLAEAGCCSLELARGLPRALGRASGRLRPLDPVHQLLSAPGQVVVGLAHVLAGGPADRPGPVHQGLDLLEGQLARAERRVRCLLQFHLVHLLEPIDDGRAEGSRVRAGVSLRTPPSRQACRSGRRPWASAGPAAADPSLPGSSGRPGSGPASGVR